MKTVHERVNNPTSVKDEIIRILKECGCANIEVYDVNTATKDPIVRHAMIGAFGENTQSVHFLLPWGTGACIYGLLNANILTTESVVLNYHIDQGEDLEEYVEYGIDYDTMEETVTFIVEDLTRMTVMLDEDDEVLTESTAGIELYTDKGALKAKALGTKVTSNKTRNKLSDLNTTSDVKELTPAQRQSIKGVVNTLSADNKLNDINKEFNNEPDIVFKANGDAVIYPDNGKAPYRLDADEIEKNESRKRTIARNKLTENTEVTNWESYQTIFNNMTHWHASDDMWLEKYGATLDDFNLIAIDDMKCMVSALKESYPELTINYRYQDYSLITVRQYQGPFIFKLWYGAIQSQRVWKVEHVCTGEVIYFDVDENSPDKSAEDIVLDLVYRHASCGEL